MQKKGILFVSTTFLGGEMKRIYSIVKNKPNKFKTLITVLIITTSYDMQIGRFNFLFFSFFTQSSFSMPIIFYFVKYPNFIYIFK